MRAVRLGGWWAWANMVALVVVLGCAGALARTIALHWSALSVPTLWDWGWLDRLTVALTATVTQPDAGVFLVVFGLLSALLMAVHEAGHWLAGRLRGYRLSQAGLGLLSGVWLTHPDGKTRTNADQLVITVGGPVAHLAGAAMLWCAARSAGLGLDAAPTLAALCAAAEALVNLLCPVPPFDGSKLISAGRATIRGHGNQPYG